MKKIKQLLTRNWINILLFLFVIFVAFASIQYVQKYTASAKTTNDVRTIWQLAITAIATSVGIGTIINSTRSASSASESMRVTKEKEAREQTSHIIPLSNIDYFPLVAPFYKEKFDYMFNRFDRSVKMRIEDKISIEGSNIIQEFENERDQYINAFQDNRFNLLDDNFVIKLVNMGKGSCVNLEYTFEFVNIEEFENYKIAPDYKLLSKSEYGYSKPISYSIEVNQELELKFKDQHLERFIDEEYPDWRLLGHGIEYNYEMKKNHVTEYANIVKPFDEIDVYLPDEFLMLCRHYMNIQYLNHQQNDCRFEFEKNTGYLKDWLTSKIIKPVGELKISFFEESLIRAGEIESNKRTELIYRISLKDIEIKFKNDEVRYYLEVNLAKPEKTFLRKKKRAYS